MASIANPLDAESCPSDLFKCPHRKARLIALQICLVSEKKLKRIQQCKYWEFQANLCEVRWCGTVYLSTCGKHKLSLALNPAAAVSSLARINVNINNTRHSWKAGLLL